MPEYKKPNNDITPKLNKIDSDINSINQEIEDLIKLKVKPNKMKKIFIYLSNIGYLFSIRKIMNKKE